eukprot:11227780-Lingulodinium_polyedra.AAC.1
MAMSSKHWSHSSMGRHPLFAGSNHPSLLPVGGRDRHLGDNTMQRWIAGLGGRTPTLSGHDGTGVARANNRSLPR